jgi:ABC-type uncharacterized transport system substrate-binding protein
VIDMMRRDFITLLGGAVSWPLTARAQQAERMRRIGILMAGTNDVDAKARVAALRAGLQELGWTEGRNLEFAVRWGGGTVEGMGVAASELVGQQPDVIMVNGTRGVAALKGETRSIPIVFAGLSDPVEHGFVESIARPGANITGFTHFQTSLIGKVLDVLKEISPQLARVALLHAPDDPATAANTRYFENVAAALKLTAISAPVRDSTDIERVIASLGDARNSGLVVVPSATAIVHHRAIIDAAAQHRVPAIHPFRLFVTAGGLMFYGADVLDLTRRSASYIDRILKGEKAADLPIQEPVKYELVINMKTAKALGLEVPPMLLARADEVIE